jgi:1,4-dihydroxy-2-naphthoyl-CoA hydrolase
VPEIPPQTFTEGFAKLVGIEVTEATDDAVRARVAVRPELLQPAGLVDGGVYATIAEDVCSAATHLAVSADRGAVAMGMSNQTSFLRPITEGTIHAVARPRHRGRTTWVWEVDFLDDDERLCALSRMTIAVREPDARPQT